MIIVVVVGGSSSTECFGAQEVDTFFLNNVFYLKGYCRTLKNSVAIF